MTKKKDREIVFLFGKQGFGKSHLAKNYIIPKLPAPVFVADCMGEYETGNIYESFDHFFRTVKISECIDAEQPNIIRIKSDKDAEQLFKFVNALQSECTLIVEESDKYMNPYKVNDTLYSMVHYGRHYAQNLVFIARRAGSLSRHLTSQATVIITFAQHENIDIKALANYTDNYNLVKEMKRREFLSVGFYEKNDTFRELKPGRVQRVEKNKLKLIR